MSNITQKKILYFGEYCHLFCDGKCYKAWGVNMRPRVMVNDKEYWVSDDEFDNAPEDPGTYEGSDGKPIVSTGRDMNRWCARQCERSKIIDIDEKPLKSKLLNFDERILLNND